MDHITTPFGARTLSLGMVAAQVVARDVKGKAAHKWKVFRAIAESKDALGVSDRSLGVLNALLTFLPETALSPGQLVVFPSNKALALRAHGMAETTLRRHLNALVQARLIIRRDSPNGKRYARKAANGDVETAFGFDLSPVLARAEEFEALAAQIAEERRAAAMARERITILRRDIGKMILAGSALGEAAQWSAFRQAYADLCHRLPRVVTAELVEPLVAKLMTLAVTVGKVLETLFETHNLEGNDSQNDAQIINSKPETNIEFEPATQKEQGTRTEPKAIPLELILKACPDITSYNKNGVKNWYDLITTAEMVRIMLGISPSAWQDAKRAMGEAGAAVALAGILQRTEAIKSPGGYLRNLTERSRAGQFSAWPMIMALLKAQSSTSKPILKGRRAPARRNTVHLGDFGR